jgi:hypothetical protein
MSAHGFGGRGTTRRRWKDNPTSTIPRLLLTPCVRPSSTLRPLHPISIPFRVPHVVPLLCSSLSVLAATQDINYLYSETSRYPSIQFPCLGHRTSPPLSRSDSGRIHNLSSPLCKAYACVQLLCRPLCIIPLF